MSKKMARILISFLLAAAVAAWAAHRLSVSDREIHLNLMASPAKFSVAVEGKTLLEWKLAGTSIPGNRLGLYMFKSFEIPDEDSCFLNLFVHSIGHPPAKFSFLEPITLESGFVASPGWRMKPGKGLFLDGPPGTRGICLLKSPETLRFNLNVEIRHPVDAGILFGASDAKNGFLLVVRPPLNDIILTTLKNGEPGPILTIAALTELNAKHEALGLAGLVGKLTVLNLAFLMLLLLVAEKVATVKRLDLSGPYKLLTKITGFRYLPFILFLATFTALSFVARSFLDGVPHIADESVYLFQAKIFASGHLWAPAPAHPEFFAFEHMILDNGRWFGKYPPLFPLLLSLGVRAGIPWAINPLVGAFSGFVLFLLAKEISGSGDCGILAWLLLLTSPFFLILNAGLMAHGLSLLLTLMFVFFSLKGLKDDKAVLFFLSGLSTGALIVTRPFTALLVLVPVAFYMGVSGVKRFGVAKTMKHSAALVLGIVPFFLFYLIWQHLFFPEKGHLMNFFYSAYSASDSLGFGPDKGKQWLKTWGSWGHTPAKGLRSMYNYLGYTALHLFGWPCGLSFAFAGIPLVFGRSKTVSFTLFSIFISLMVGHMFYWATQHLGYGARYWFSGMAGLVVLTAMGIRYFRDGAAGVTAGDFGARGRVSLLVGLVLVGLTVWNMAFYLPNKLDECHHYGNIGAELRDAVAELQLKKSLVFVKTENLMFNDGFFMNDPFMRKGILFARDLGARNRTLIEAYPEYDIYLWDKNGLIQVFERVSMSAEDTGR